MVYKIDIPANRYDLLCLEGIARGLLVFLGTEPMPDFRSVHAARPHRGTTAPRGPRAGRVPRAV